MPDTPYSVITISFVCLLFYGISLAFERMGIVTGEWQRKVWNTLLLLSVYVAGSIGLLLAITVNYKINLPVFNKLLVWHVDFGVALVLISIFHFSHHIKYYLRLFRKTGAVSKSNEKHTFGQHSLQTGYRLGFNLKRLPFSLGFTAMATQLILLREFLAVFYGNELSIGIVLANWLLLTGVGAVLNRKTTNQPVMKGILTGLFLLAIVPVVMLFLLYWLRNIVLPVGSLPGIGQIILGTAFLLSPFCLLSGWLFSAVSLYLSNSLKQNAISLTYEWETLGSVVAGILCSLILIFLFEPFQNLAIVLIINSSILFLISRKEIYSVRKKFYLYLVAAVFVGFATLIANLDKNILQFLYPGQKIISFKDTPYGKLVVTEKAGQLNFFDNNTLLFTTNNVIANEETVHYALLQRKITGNVLLVGGSISGVADECLKYPLKRLECVELNPRILLFGRTFNLLPHDPRLKIYFGDARIMVKRKQEEKAKILSRSYSAQKALDPLSYEAIILNIPEPTTLQINRLYTCEFFGMCKTLLVEKGMLSMSLASTTDYMGADALKIQSTMYQTLKTVFQNVVVIPGEKNYFLASDGPLTPAVTMLGADQKIETEYVNEYYLDDASLAERSANIMKRISVQASVNRDLSPVGCYRQLHYWLSYQGNFNFYLLVIPLIILLIIAGIRASGTTVALFSAGLSSFSLEIILILTFQVIYGYVYLATGVFITLFMVGLALGVMSAKALPAKPTYKSLVFLQMLSAGLILLTTVYIFFLTDFQIKIISIHLIFSFLIIIMAMITGAQFHIASVLKEGNISQIAASSYSADLIGSAVGALLVNAWLVPLLGFIDSLLIVTLGMVSAIIIMILKKHT